MAGTAKSRPTPSCAFVAGELRPEKLLAQRERAAIERGGNPARAPHDVAHEFVVCHWIERERILRAWPKQPMERERAAAPPQSV